MDDYSLYSKVIEENLPLYKSEQEVNNPYYILNEGRVAEAFDAQAVGAIEAGIAKYWYPQYLATVIIAVDRDKTDAVVNHWNDLIDTQVEIGFFNSPGNKQMLLAAMSYGLEGENYSVEKAIQLLSSLYDDNRLIMNSFDSPILICFDYQAANLIRSGRNIEIIIPAEGTYTYEKGLLSNEKINFQNNISAMLIESNMRLLDGQCNLSVFPTEIDYKSAVRVSDYKHFINSVKKAQILIERKILNAQKYMSIDNQEHLNFALLYIIIVTIWLASILRRSMQKAISYSAFFTGIILNAWILVRLIKYQNDTIPILNRYLWYSFYIFQLSLPLVLLWMAWAIDKPENKTFPPKWWRAMAILIVALIALVFTNDLHGCVFHLDLTRLDWSKNYSYGFGYYIILCVCMLNLLAVFIILVQKSIRNTRKGKFIFPISVLIVFGFYNYKYIMRDPFIYQTDLTIITGIFTMLMFESCIRSGLIPVNTKYVDLFIRSPLKMQIINKNRKVLLESASASALNIDILNKVIDSYPSSIMQDDFLLFAKPIPGGYAIWNEDVSQINKLHREFEESTKMLTAANALLAEEEKLKRDINERVEKKRLMEQLEIEISDRITQLTTMIENLPKAQNHSIEATRIALLLCYIKRRCNLFFQEKRTNTMDIEELIIYIDELSDIAKKSDINIATINEIETIISIRHGILFYDFYYFMIDLAVRTSHNYSIQNFEEKNGFIAMGFLTSQSLKELKLEKVFINAIDAAKGKIITKNLEDSIGISISFPKGGYECD